MRVRPGFFDAVISIGSFVYYGTDDLYANYLAGFVRPEADRNRRRGSGAGDRWPCTGAPQTVVGAEHGACLHSAIWWRRHWQRSGVLEVELADTMPDGWRRWLDWQHAVAPDNRVEIEALQATGGATSAMSGWSGTADPTSRRTSGSNRDPFDCHLRLDDLVVALGRVDITE